ncbi:hypothetical protein Vafri_7772, partial [Volvox africanus]
EECYLSCSYYRLISKSARRKKGGETIRAPEDDVITANIHKLFHPALSGSKIRDPSSEAKKQRSGLEAAEEQLQCQVGDSMAQLEDLHKQLKWMQAEKEEQIAAIQRKATVSQAELEALHCRCKICTVILGAEVALPTFGSIP